MVGSGWLTGAVRRPEPRAIDTVAVIEAPEHVRFEHALAGPARRAAAYLADTLVRGLVLFVLGVLLRGTLSEAVFRASLGVLLVVAFLLEWGYFVLFETLMDGRTPGKRLLRLRVIREGGEAIGFGDSVLRNLLRAADVLPFGYALGGVVSILDRRFRRLGDLAAGTMVVAEARGARPRPLQVRPPPTEAELAALPARPPLTRADLEALELFLRRVGTLSPAREDELAALVAPVYARRLGGLRYSSPSRFLALLHHRATRG